MSFIIACSSKQLYNIVHILFIRGAFMIHQQLLNKPIERQPFFNGMKAGISISIGYIPIGMAFGLLAKSFDLPIYIIILMSIMIFAGASQFIGVNLIIAGSSMTEIILATFILNLRHLLMTASLSLRLPDQLSRKWLALLAFGVTDETFSIASIQKNKALHPHFVLGLNSIAYFSWIMGTTSGIYLAFGLPKIVQNSIGIALYCMFIGLMIPSIKKSRPIITVIIIAIIMSTTLHYLSPIEITTGWNIIITTLVSSFIGAILYPNVGEIIES